MRLLILALAATPALRRQLVVPAAAGQPVALAVMTEVRVTAHALGGPVRGCAVGRFHPRLFAAIPAAVAAVRVLAAALVGLVRGWAVDGFNPGPFDVDGARELYECAF